MSAGIGKREKWGYGAAFGLTVAADQWFKHWITVQIPLGSGKTLPMIPGIVHLTYIQNRGAAFGMLQGKRWYFLALLAAFCVLVIWALRTGQLPDRFSRWLAVLATGGAVANGIDRALRGYVVDMFELEFMHFAVFNLADFVMNVCAILFVIHMLLHWKKLEGSGPQPL